MMSQKLITLPISDELYERARKVAEVSDRSAEEVLVESLKYSLQPGLDLPPLDALAEYSNVQLWLVVLNDLSPSDLERLHELAEKNKWEQLNEVEERELDHLVDLVNQYML